VASRRDVVVSLEFSDKGTAKIKKATQEVRTTLENANASAGKASAGFDKLRQKSESAAKGVGKLKTAAGGLKTMILSMAAGMGIATGMTAIFSKLRSEMMSVVEAGRAFSKTWALTTTMLNVSAEETAKMRRQLMQLSPTLGTAKDLAWGMYQVLSASVPAENAVSFLAEASKAAIAGATDTFTAVDALTTVLNAYGMEAEKVTKVSDIMFQTVQRGKTTYPQLAGALGTVVPMAAQVGVSFEEIGAAVATLTRQGIDVNTTTTQLRQILATVLGPGAAATSMARQLGLEFSSTAVKTKGLVGFLQDVLVKTGGNVDVLNVLFGNIRALSGVMGLAANGAKEFSGDLERMANAAGASDAAFKKQMQSTDFWLTAIKNAIEKFKIGLFEGLTEGFFKGIKSQEEYQKKFEEWAKGVFDKGKKIGESINRAINQVIKFGKALYELRGPIKKIIDLYIIWIAVSKTAALSAGIQVLTSKFQTLGIAAGMVFEGRGFMGKVRNAGILMGKGLGGAITGVGGALKALGPAAIAGFAGWKIGRLIGEVTGLDKGIQSLFSNLWKAKDRTGGTDKGHDLLAPLQEAMTKRAADISGKAVLNVMDALKILKKQYFETGSAGNKMLDDYAEKMGWAKKAIVETNNALSGAYKNLVTLLKESTSVQNEALIASSSIAKQKITELGAAEAILRDEFEKTGTTGSMTLDAWIERTKITGMTLIEMKAKLKEYGYTLKMELGDRYQVLSTILQKFGGELTRADYKRVKEEVNQLGIALGKTSAAFSELGLVTAADTKDKLEELGGWLKEINVAFLAHTMPIWQYEKALAAIQERLAALGPYFKATLKGIQELANTPLPAPKQWKIEMPELDFEAQDMFKAEWLVDPFMQVDKAAALLGVTLKHDLINNLDELKKAWESLKANSQTTPATLVQAAGTLAAAYKALGQKVPKELEGIAASTIKTWDGVAEAMVNYWTQAMAEMIQSGLNFRDVINMAWQTIATGAGKALGNMATKALSSLGAMAGPIGGLIGTVAGGLISGIGKLFGIKSKAQKEAEAAKKAEAALQRQVDAVTRSYKLFGDITESTAKKVIDLTKQFNRQTATIMTLIDVMNDAGISSNNLTRYLQKMATALRDIGRGTVDAQKGIEAIGAAFSQVIGWVQKFGGEGKKAIVQFIQALREAGASIVEVDEYVFSQLDKGAEGMKNMITAVGGASYTQLLDYRDQIKALGEEVSNLSGQRLSDRSAQLDYLRKKAQLEDLRSKYEDLKVVLGDELAPEMERMSRLTLTTFNAFIAQGKSWSETVALMKDSLTGLRDKYTELGITGGDAIQELFKIVDITEANAGLLEGIEGSRQLLEALGNTGFLTAESMTDLADQAASYFDQLVAGGADSRQALAMIAPQLADLQYYAEQYGLALDDGTKALIEQAKAEGVFRERGKDLAETLKEGFEGIIEKLNELIGAFGGSGGLIDRMREGLYYGKQYNALTYGAMEGQQATMAQSGFKGIVTGPRLFGIEKGVTEAVHIGEPAEVFDTKLVKTADMLTRIKDSITKSVTTMVQNMTSIAEQQAAAVVSEFAFAGAAGAIAGAPARTFFIPPAAQQPISVAKTGDNKAEEKVIVIDKNITFEPVVIPFKEFESFVIKWVQKASADERVLVRPRSVRGRG
jgi:TP901 family phage tail tape measure protein